MTKEKQYRALTTRDTVRPDDLIIDSKGFKHPVGGKITRGNLLGEKWCEGYRIVLREVADFEIDKDEKQAELIKEWDRE